MYVCTRIMFVQKRRQIFTLTSYGGDIVCTYKLTNFKVDKSIINHDVRTKNHIISSFKSHLKEVCGLKWSP